MIRRDFIKKLTSIHPSLVSIRTRKSQIDVERLEQESSTVEVFDEDAKLREEEIDKKRNKSRLRLSDRNILFENTPYLTPTSWHHGTIKYLRKNYGRYGESSGVNPSICWPNTRNDCRCKEKRIQKEERVRARQEDIVKKMEKLEMWKQDLYNRMAKKESEAKAAKERKERLIEEVRRHFGYTVDPRDERFKEMLEKKEKEQKKAMKEARRKARDEKIVDRILKKKETKKNRSDTECSGNMHVAFQIGVFPMSVYLVQLFDASLKLAMFKELHKELEVMAIMLIWRKKFYEDSMKIQQQAVGK
ncbi:hypothetical protein NQ318_020917 [Aromia moschata]|uniref:Large ribosomal subunit protein mL64 n=1 Tax=Aromia moschata TaxID=1265417 RepID=A0AAV8X662_9CUCU|nr:hypothetical protein NQ318_020917 [Aromia moschata]